MSNLDLYPRAGMAMSRSERQVSRAVGQLEARFAVDRTADHLAIRRAGEAAREGLRETFETAVMAVVYASALPAQYAPLLEMQVHKASIAIDAAATRGRF